MKNTTSIETTKKYSNQVHDKIPVVNITKNKEYNQEEINKFSFNRKTRREMASMERTQPEKDRKFKIKSNIQEGKQEHQKAIREKQEKTHLKCLLNKIKN